MQLLVTVDLAANLIRLRNVFSPITDHPRDQPIHIAMTENEALNIAHLLAKAVNELRTANERLRE